MKKAVILHGTDGKPSDHWLGWINDRLKDQGYEVFAPLLPNNHTPDRETYEKFLKQSGWDFKDNIIIGHSSGATTILNLLSTDWFPKVKAAVLVGTFLNEDLLQVVDWYEPGQFDGLFLSDYDADLIKQKADKIILIHGDDDPYCGYEDARKMSEKLGASFVTIKGGGHMSSSFGVTEVPEMLEELSPLI